MSKRLMIDQFHLSVYLPKNLPRSAATSASRVLETRKVRTALRQVIKRVLRSFPPLSNASIRLSR